MISRKSSLERELEIVLKQEQKYIDKYKEKKESFLNQKLAQKIPNGLQEKLDAAFGKAFFLVFDKGTGIIEKTYKKEDLEHGYKVNAYSAEIRENKSTLRTFKKGAAASSRKNLLLSTAEGVGLGGLGIKSAGHSPFYRNDPEKYL